MKYIILTLLLFSASLYAVTMPVKRVKLTSTFGESRNDHFHNGVDLGAGEQNVYSFQHGKIIFYYDKSEFPFGNYPGAGNFVILDHNDTRSYYMHLKDNSINKTNYDINEGACIGRTSDTGHSYGIHLHFSIERKRPLEIPNPLVFFKDFINDTIRPRIERLFIKIDDSDLIPIFNSYRISHGSKISLFLKTYDMVHNNNNKIGIYRITCYVNNEKFREYIFDKLIIKNNYYYLPSGHVFDEVYLDKYLYILGEFLIEEKQYDIEIVVEDFFNNSAKIKRQLIVR